MCELRWYTAVQIELECSLYHLGTRMFQNGVWIILTKEDGGRYVEISGKGKRKGKCAQMDVMEVSIVGNLH